MVEHPAKRAITRLCERAQHFHVSASSKIIIFRSILMKEDEATAPIVSRLLWSPAREIWDCLQGVVATFPSSFTVLLYTVK